MIEPRLLLSVAKGSQPQPVKFKVASYCLLGIAFAIGLYSSHVLLRK